MFKIRVILLLSLWFVSIPSTLGQKEFCKSFVGNKHSIDYGFQLEPNKEDYSLVIGSEFWKVNWTEDHAQLENESESKTSNLFDSRYIAAFGGVPCGIPNTICQTNHNVKAGFLLKNYDSIDWNLINIKTFNRSKAISPLPKESYQIPPLKSFNFKPTVGYFTGERFMLLEQKPVQKGSGTLFSTTFKELYILEDGSVRFDQKYDNKTEYGYPIMAVFSKGGIGTYLYLLKDNQRILYCRITNADKGMGECTPNANQILIDCSSPQLNPLPTIGATASNSSSIPTSGGTPPNVNPLTITGNPVKKPNKNITPNINPLSTTGATTSGSSIWLSVILVLAIVLIIIAIIALVYYGQRSAPKDGNNSKQGSNEPEREVQSKSFGQNPKATQRAQNESSAGRTPSARSEGLLTGKEGNPIS